MTIILHGEVVPKKNSRITLRNGRTIPSKRYVQWHDIAMLEARSQLPEGLPIDSPCRVSVTLIHGDLRRRDGDNAVSSILDLLQDCGALADDSWQIVREIVVRNGYEKNEPRAVISVERLTTGDN